MAVRVDPAGILHIYDAVKEAGRAVTLGELVVFSWWKAPGLFGIEGFTDVHPDSHRVSYRLWGANGMVARGYLKYDKNTRIFLPGVDPRSESRQAQRSSHATSRR